MKILANTLRFFISFGFVAIGLWYFTGYKSYYFNDLSNLHFIIVASVILAIIIAFTIALSKIVTFGFEKEKKKN